MELVVEVGNDEPGMAIAKNVCGIHAHSGFGYAVFIEGDFGFVATVDKSSIALVYEQ